MNRRLWWERVAGKPLHSSKHKHKHKQRARDTPILCSKTALDCWRTVSMHLRAYRCMKSRNATTQNTDLKRCWGKNTDRSWLRTTQMVCHSARTRILLQSILKTNSTTVSKSLKMRIQQLNRYLKIRRSQNRRHLVRTPYLTAWKSIHSSTMTVQWVTRIQTATLSTWLHLREVPIASNLTPSLKSLQWPACHLPTHLSLSCLSRAMEATLTGTRSCRTWAVRHAQLPWLSATTVPTNLTDRTLHSALKLPIRKDKVLLMAKTPLLISKNDSAG